MRLSRSKIDLFLNCPKCFYLDVKLHIKQPGGFPFTINSEIDRLLKNEFDIPRVSSSFSTRAIFSDIYGLIINCLTYQMSNVVIIIQYI